LGATNAMASRDWTIDEQDQLIAEAVERDEPRLRSFIRKRVMDMGDAEDVLQEVFYELTEAYRLTKPIEESDCVAVSGGAEPDHGFVPAEEGCVAERAWWWAAKGMRGRWRICCLLRMQVRMRCMRAACAAGRAG
jgi:hypothetical protein